MTRAVVFLDRDGTLNIDKGYVQRPEDWEFTDGAPEALRDLKKAGFALALVTNQSGIGRGYFRLEDVQALHQYVQERLAEYHVQLDAIAICPHAPGAGCDCRKPATGMARQIEAQLAGPIAYRQSWVVGDKLSDLGFGRAVGTRVALLRSAYWQEEEIDNGATIIIADSLQNAAQAIISKGIGED